MLIINGPRVHTDNDDEHYKTLVEREAKADKNYDTLSNYHPIPIGSTIVEREDRGPLTHGTIIDKGDQSHNDQLYRIYMAKMRWLIMRNAEHDM